MCENSKSSATVRETTSDRLHLCKPRNTHIEPNFESRVGQVVKPEAMSITHHFAGTEPKTTKLHLVECKRKT